ncbi:MAG: hypothetical protein HPY83_12465 [Anaerolineae bacterium]|nr:hypothetical protein [Anaerolineae bacterium]
MECPNCGTYNPEDRTQCWKCDELLPTKKEERPKRNEQGRLSPWTWLVLIVLGGVWFFTQCSSPLRQEPTTRHQPPPPVVRPLI